jgi:hypothetical protein
MIAKTQIPFPTHVVLTLSVGLLVAFVSPLAAAPESIVTREKPVPDLPSATAVPLDQVGAVAGKAYQGDGLSVSATGEGARLRCDFQRLEGEATPCGLWLRSTAHNGDTDRFRVTASGLGRDVLKRLPVAGEVAVAGQTVRFSRFGLVEEYSVSMDGIRQDFVLDQRPAGAGELRVELDVTGATVEAQANGVRLTLQASGRKLAYNRLHVSDATGRELPARMEMIGTEYDISAVPAPQLCVKVDDSDAVYPVRIDPTFSDAYWISMGTTYPGTDGTVDVTHVDAAGNLYIGGSFTHVGNIAANGVAKWNGTNWSSMGLGIVLGPGEAVYGLATSGNDLFVGGTFQKAGGVTVNGIAKWNGTNWSALGSGVSIVSGDGVYVLEASGGNLYAAGRFSSISGVSANRIARWNGTAWSPLGSGVPAAVYALAASGSDLYAGGNFFTAGGVTVNFVAKWNGNAWSALGSGVTATVTSLGVAGTNLYVGGIFGTAGGISANRIAKWNGSNWSALGTGLDNEVYTLEVSGNDVYAGGIFWNAGGTPAIHVAKWNGTTWSPLSGGLDGEVYFLSASGSNLYAGGTFQYASEIRAQHVAKWNGSSWSVPGGGSGLNAGVRVLAAYGNDLYVGGIFTAIGETNASRIAKWNGATWSPLGTGMNGGVWLLAASSNWVYAAGDFTNAGGIAVDRIARWNGSAWSSLGAGLNGYVIIRKLAVWGNDLYVGGDFDSIGGIAATNIAKWDGNAWSGLGSGFNSYFGVHDLVVSGNALYVAGDNVVAKWNGSSWSALGSGPQNVGQYIQALAVSGNTVYAGDYSGTIHKWNGTDWSYHYTSLYSISRMVALNGDLYIGGLFYPQIPGPFDYIAKWDGANTSALGSGVNNAVYDLVISGNALYVGGDFTVAGGKNSAYVAKAIIAAAQGRFQNPTFSPLTGFNCTFTDGTIGYPYRIQTSPNVAAGPWTDYTSFTYTVPRVITDATAISGTNRFFRAVSP